MKVRVRYRRWEAGQYTQGAAARKLTSEQKRNMARWENPPRYEIEPRTGNERAEKVVRIREHPMAQMAEIRPIRPVMPAEQDVEQLTPAELVHGLTHILNPASVFFLALALWRLGSDLGMTSQFALTEGPLSHWQVWVAASGGLQALGYALRKRFAESTPASGRDT